MRNEKNSIDSISVKAGGASLGVAIGSLLSTGVMIPLVCGIIGSVIGASIHSHTEEDTRKPDCQYFSQHEDSKEDNEK